MTGMQLKQAREARGWTQADTARRLRVTQAYVSMLEGGHRRLPLRLVHRILRVLALPAVALPLPAETALRRPRLGLNNTTLGTPFATWDSASEDDFAGELAALGYAGFSFLKGKTPRWNPAELLLAMLTRPQLDSRLLEALPWLTLRYPDLDWAWAVRQAKLYDVQNRLGFVVNLAELLAERKGDPATASRLKAVLAPLQNALLAKEDTLCHESLSQAERKWLRVHRPPEAQKWNLLSDMKVAHLDHAA